MRLVYTADVDGASRGSAYMGHLEPSLYGGAMTIKQVIVEEPNVLGANSARAEFALRADGESLIGNTQSISSNTTAETFGVTGGRARRAVRELLEFEVVNQASTPEDLAVSVIADSESREGEPAWQ